MRCEFEEKTYEQYHNMELVSGDKIFFPPGQLQEKSLGIDVALFSKNRKFWRLWGYYKWFMLWSFPTGISLSDLLEYALWEKLKDIINAEDFPTFKFNIFIQYKRPEYIKSARGKEYRFWMKPYFRYDILQHQQDILFSLEQKLDRKAIVTYAAPAFYKMNELLNFFSMGKLVENSNYVKPSALDGHTRWTYINGGIRGIAFSEPEENEGFSFWKELKEIREQTEGIRYENNTEFLEYTANMLVETLKDSGYYWRVFSRIIELLHLPEHRLGRNLIKIYTFLLITRVRWGIGYE